MSYDIEAGKDNSIVKLLSQEQRDRFIVKADAKDRIKPPRELLIRTTEKAPTYLTSCHAFHLICCPCIIAPTGTTTAFVQPQEEFWTLKRVEG